MLDEIEAELATAGPAETRRLRSAGAVDPGSAHAERITFPRRDLDGTAGSGRAPPVWTVQAGGVAWGHQPSSRPQPRAERVPERSNGAVSMYATVKKARVSSERCSIDYPSLCRIAPLLQDNFWQVSRS